MKFAELALFERENPDFDFEAEELRKEAERQAAVIKERQDKQTYFFYGSLMDPQTAQQVLGLETPPTMRPAIFTKGGQLKMWGPFPALVTDEKPKLDIKGMACEVEGAERKDRLAAYEGDSYGEVSSCMIFVFRDDGSTDWVMGKMFDWAGSKEDLKDGTFDLEAYKAAKARVDAAEK